MGSFSNFVEFEAVLRGARLVNILWGGRKMTVEDLDLCSGLVSFRQKRMRSGSTCQGKPAIAYEIVSILEVATNC
jgi:hypothetical protein